MRKFAFLAVLGHLLGGCVGAGLEGANIARDRLIVDNNIGAAQKGDPVAQFKVGEALCCSPRETKGTFYNTKLSVAWLCASARQGHAPAMYKIGKIYSGDVVDGVRLIRRAAMGLAGSSENHPIAYSWLRHAAARNEPDAQNRADEVWRGLNEAERQEAARILQTGALPKCLWEEVIGAGR